MLLTIIAFIIILGLLVFVHGLGHFFAARKMGVKVEEFGFGFPPRIIGIKKGETIYSINWIPIGGFVKIKGESGEQKDDTDSFAHKKAWQKSSILVAGVLMNFIFAWLIFSIGFTAGIPTVLDNSNRNSARDKKIQIQSILVDSPAQKAGLTIGDEIYKLDNQEFKDLVGIQNYISNQIDKTINLTIKRGNQEINYSVSPQFSKEENRAVIGVGLVETGLTSYPIYRAIWEGLKRTISLIGLIVVAFYDVIKNLIISGRPGVELAGPIGIAVLTGQVVDLGLIYVLQFAAILSINLGIINILPFPALDGGRVLFVLIEKIRRRPNNQRIENLIHNIGFSLLILLIVLVTYRDLTKFGGKIIEAVKRVVS